MTDHGSHNGHEELIKDPLSVCGKEFKKRVAQPDEDETNQLSGPRIGRFPMWLVVTAYVLITLSILYTAPGLINSLNR